MAEEIDKQGEITISGVLAVLKACPIQELCIRDESVQPENFKLIVQASHTLFAVICNLPEGDGDIMNSKHLNESIIACNGRVIFLDDDWEDPYYRAPAYLPRDVLDKQKQTISADMKLCMVRRSQWPDRSSHTHQSVLNSSGCYY